MCSPWVWLDRSALTATSNTTTALPLVIAMRLISGLPAHLLSPLPPTNKPTPSYSRDITRLSMVTPVRLHVLVLPFIVVRSVTSSSSIFPKLKLMKKFPELIVIPQPSEDFTETTLDVTEMLSLE